MTFSAEDALGAASLVDVQLANGNPVKVLVDGWRNPIVFYRWPVFNPDLNSPPLPQGFRDPCDPLGLLNTPAWVNSPGFTQFQVWCHPLPSTPGVSFYLLPVVASFGKDGQPGLLDQYMTPDLTTPASFDNIYSYRLRLGSRGDQ
jgi:hypothetical protein